MKILTKHWILIYSFFVNILLIATALLTIELTQVNLSYLAVTIISIFLFPYSFYEYSSRVKIKRMEDQFPIFLKDLSDSLRAGVTVSEAIRTASKGDYRELNPEIMKMSNQMSWGVAFEKVIRDTLERLKESVYITRGLAILLQSFQSGGDISPIMTSVADSTILLKNVEKDQESSMTEQTAIIYVIQIVFMIITVVLFRVLIPILNSGGLGTELIGGTGGNVDLDYFKNFFFVTIIIQSVSNGLVAGVTQSSSLTAGMKHVAIMFSVSLVLFTIFILPKVLSVNSISERYAVVRGEEFRIFGTVNYDNDVLSNQRVTLELGNQTWIGFTDDAGDYDITIEAPDERGRADGIVRVEYEGQKAESTFSFTTR